MFEGVKGFWVRGFGSRVNGAVVQGVWFRVYVRDIPGREFWSSGSRF